MASIQSEIVDRQKTLNLNQYDDAIILGVGGIGSWVALNLALSGKIDVLHIVDPDEIESSNLNRTPFRLCDIGVPKVDALKYLILERRVMEVYTYCQKTDVELSRTLKDETNLAAFMNQTTDSVKMSNKVIIIDCRDDVFEDFYDYPCKYYKIGYDGLEVTIDGNPRNTAVWGRANSYRVTPSFVCPAQMAASLIVTDVLTKVEDSNEIIDDNTPPYDVITNNRSFDLIGRINTTFTFNTSDILETMYRASLENKG